MRLWDLFAKMIASLFNLLRVRQWYKNLVVFLALFFSANLFDGSLFLTTLLAFFALCFVSSAGYILNDIADRHQDRFHPEKKLRPLAAGKISLLIAVLLVVLLFIAGSLIAFILGASFFYIVLALFLLSLLYTFVLKKIVFADILTIASLFVLRAVSGAVAINVTISPWLVLCPFFLSLFLSVGKRHAELHLLQEKASATRKVLGEYTHELTDSLMGISTTLLVISYALYSFLSEYNYLLYTLPFALFVMFRFYYLINSGSAIARHAERVIKDWPMVVGIILWVLATAGLIYV